MAEAFADAVKAWVDTTCPQITAARDADLATEAAALCDGVPERPDDTDTPDDTDREL
jgi:hypothetical protein